MNKPDASIHEQVAELLPWLVNGSLSDDERQQIHDHARNCVACRRDIEELELLQRSVGSAADAPALPAADMRRLNQRIDEYEARRRRVPAILQSLGRLLPRPMTAVVALQALVIVGLGALLLNRADDPVVYETLTNEQVLPAGDYLRISVSAEMSAAALSNLLQEHGLTVVYGPTERGVATLAFPQLLPANARQRIRDEVLEDADVRFAQAVTIN